MHTVCYLAKRCSDGMCFFTLKQRDRHQGPAVAQSSELEPEDQAGSASGLAPRFLYHGKWHCSSRPAHVAWHPRCFSSLLHMVVQCCWPEHAFMRCLPSGPCLPMAMLCTQKAYEGRIDLVVLRQATLVAVVCEDGSCHYMDMLRDTHLGYQGALQAHTVLGPVPASCLAQKCCAWGCYAYTLYTTAGEADALPVSWICLLSLGAKVLVLQAPAL